MRRIRSRPRSVKRASCGNMVDFFDVDFFDDSGLTKVVGYASLRGSHHRDRSSSPADLGPPPAGADQQEPPVLKKLRRLAFEGMANELENPSGEEKAESI